MAFPEFCWYTVVSKPCTLRTTYYPFGPLEIYKLCNEIALVKYIRIHILQWAGHKTQMMNGLHKEYSKSGHKGKEELEDKR